MRMNQESVQANIIHRIYTVKDIHGKRVAL